jgi:cytochrome P450
LTDAQTAYPAEFNSLRAGAQPEGFDPYPVYSRLRQHAPIWRSPWGDWYLSSFAAVSEAITHPALHRSPAHGEGDNAGGVIGLDGPLACYLREWLLFADPPAHTQLRRKLLGLFQMRDAAALRRTVGKLCLAALNGGGDGRGDFMELVAGVVPVRVILELLGIPQTDQRQIVQWSSVLRRILDSGLSENDTEATVTIAAIQRYFLDLVRDEAWRSSKPGDRLKPLIEAFPAEAVAANLAMLAFAGQETTAHLIGSMFFHLGRRPDLWQRLRHEPDRAARAVGEALRLESPVQKICRWPHGAAEIGGVTLTDGELLVLLVGAAHRDPAQNGKPDVFDIDRPTGGHLAFGWGIHLCLGRPLALLESETILRVLLEQWRQIDACDGGWAWLNNSSFRGLRRLDLAWSAAAAR